MFERECKLYAFVLNYARLLSADIDEARMAEQPAAGMNHPAWILGHLAICTDYAAKVLGLEKQCPDQWHKQFGPGSTPTSDRSAYPSKAELLAALAAGHERIAAAALNADPKRMASPHKVDIAFVKVWMPTLGDLLAHLMTTHPASHLGQLSAWRRTMGLPGVLAL
jgi:hypothetical protein